MEEEEGQEAEEEEEEDEAEVGSVGTTDSSPPQVQVSGSGPAAAPRHLLTCAGSRTLASCCLTC